MDGNYLVLLSAIKQSTAGSMTHSWRWIDWYTNTTYVFVGWRGFVFAAGLLQVVQSQRRGVSLQRQYQVPSRRAPLLHKQAHLSFAAGREGAGWGPRGPSADLYLGDDARLRQRERGPVEAARVPHGQHVVAARRQLPRAVRVAARAVEVPSRHLLHRLVRPVCVPHQARRVILYDTSSLASKLKKLSTYNICMYVYVLYIQIFKYTHSRIPK